MSDEQKETTGQDWSAVASVGTESEASFIVGFLESRGIPTRIVDKSFSQNPVPADEDLASIEVAVPSDRFEEASASPREARRRLRLGHRGRGDPHDRRRPGRDRPDRERVELTRIPESA